VEALRLPQIASLSQSVSERLLHCVPRTVDIPEHPERDREIAPVPVSIRLFDGGNEVNVRNRAHKSY
jgi:hypothetical protein